jgi:hypothetical protein
LFAVSARLESNFKAARHCSLALSILSWVWYSTRGLRVLTDVRIDLQTLLILLNSPVQGILRNVELACWIALSGCSIARYRFAIPASASSLVGSALRASLNSSSAC